MDVPLTVRNLTPKSVFLESAKRYHLGSKLGPSKASSNAAHPQSGFKSNDTLFEVPKNHGPHNDTIKENSQIQQWIEPSKITKTHITAPKLPLETLELHLSIDGEAFFVNLPQNLVTKHILEGRSLAKSDLTVLYSASDGFLVFCFSSGLSSWMDRLKDDTPLTALSIPGTHNSPAHHKALPSIRCQAATLSEQLQNGVRFLDIRVQVHPNESDPRKRLVLVHSVFSVKLVGHNYLHSLLGEIFLFLRAYPSETILMSIKRDSGKGTNEQVGTVLKDHYAGDQSKWFTAPRIPYLGEVRGKIVLIRRFGLDETLKHEYGGAGWGIDASVWADNTPESTCPSGHICVQDYYSMLEPQDVEKKLQYSQYLLAKAAQRSCDPRDGGTPDEHPLIINFLTGSNLWKRSCWPERIAATLNPQILDYLCRKHSIEPERAGDGGTGIVVCDWVGHNGNWDIVKCIVALNSRYDRQKRLPTMTTDITV